MLEELEKVKNQRDTLRTALLGVIACFKSRTQSSTCINDHHPSCLEYLEKTLTEVDGG